LIVQFQVWHIAMPFEGGDHSIVDLSITIIDFASNGNTKRKNLVERIARFVLTAQKSPIFKVYPLVKRRSD